MHVEVEHEDAEHAASDAPDAVADAVADGIHEGIVDAAHELQAEETLERTEDLAEQAAEDASAARAETALHSHPEYEHDHSGIESRIAELEQWRAQSTVVDDEETPQEELVEPVAEETSADVPSESESHKSNGRNHRGLRRGGR